MRSPRRKAPSRPPKQDDEPRVDAIRDEMRTEPADTRNRRVIAVVRMRRLFKKRGQ